MDVGLKWILQWEGVKHLGVLIGSHLSFVANFDNLMASFKAKLISWGNNKLSLTTLFGMEVLKGKELKSSGTL